MYKIKLEGVSKTLLLTLNAKAKLGILGKKYVDPESLKLLNQIDYPFEKFNTSIATNLYVVARSHLFDQWLKRQLEKNPDAIVINLAAGLDTRHKRFQECHTGYWYDLDLPQVIEVRRKFFVEDEKYQMLATSVLDFEWLNQIQKQHDQKVLIIAEGLLMYLTAEENMKLVNELKLHFQHFCFLFDHSHALTRRFFKVMKVSLNSSLDQLKFGEDMEIQLKNVFSEVKNKWWASLVNFVPPRFHASIVVEMTYQKRN